MMALDQLLVARLELLASDLRGQVEDLEHALGAAEPGRAPIPFGGAMGAVGAAAVEEQLVGVLPAPGAGLDGAVVAERPGRPVPGHVLAQIDRKSTRLNSSH